MAACGSPRIVARPPAALPRAASTVTATHHLGASASALSVSADGERVAVAGRDLLRTLSVKAGPALADDLDLLQHTKKSPNHSSNDAQWYPHRPSQLVTGATTGAVLLWDAAKAGSKLARTLSVHTRAVNRVHFQPGESTRLLTGAKDCSVKLLDVGVRPVQQLAFATSAEVRRRPRSPVPPAPPARPSDRVSSRAGVGRGLPRRDLRVRRGARERPRAAL